MLCFSGPMPAKLFADDAEEEISHAIKKCIIMDNLPVAEIISVK